MSLDDFELLPKVDEAVNALRSAGFKLICVTNQPDVGAGKQKKEIVEAMNRRMQETLKLDRIQVCYHTEDEDCLCRKPKPGMLLEAAKEESVDLTRSFMVGDRWRDIEAGKAAGCKTVLIQYDYTEKEAKNPDYTAQSLFEASRLILSDVEKGK